MCTTSQTIADVKSVIEIIEQRIHELATPENTNNREVQMLNALHKQASGILSEAL